MLIEGLLGTVTGIIGNAVGAWFKFKDRKLELEGMKLTHEHEVNMVRIQTQAMIAEAKANIKITQAQVEGAIEIEDSRAFMEAQKLGNKSLFSYQWIDGLMQIQGWWRIITFPVASLIAFLFGFIDFLRGLIRPALTIYLCGVTTWVTYMAWEIMQRSEITLSAIQAVDIFNDTISIVTYLTVTAVTFWFGDRQMSKNIMKLKGVDTNKMNDEINI
jgi:hypothetical protein